MITFILELKKGNPGFKKFFSRLLGYYFYPIVLK